MSRPSLPPRVRTQRGAASLVVVMVLFFIITLVAAYASRNLLFEQRTSTNQYRSTLAFETAEAGVEWVLARLNDARMNDDCTPITNPGAVGTHVSFRDRYLTIDGTNGGITPVAGGIAGCIFNGSNWVCDCPAPGSNPSPAVTYTGNGPFAAFWVQFVEVTPVVPGVTGIVRMQVNACTRVDETCLRFTPVRAAQSGDGLATVWVTVALRSALNTAPAAALTVRGTFDNGGRTPTVSNTDPVSGGITIQGGGAVDVTGITLLTVPGSPPALSVMANEASLQLADLTLTPATPANSGTNRMFNSVFGMWPSTFLAQPGLAEVDCTSDCTAADVNNQVLLKPGHPVYVSGGGRLRVGADIGSATAPVLIVADGQVEFDGVHTLYGVVYNRRATWDFDGDGTLRGAGIAESNFRFADNDLSLVYDRDVILRLRNRTGSFVKVPGGWRDFQP